MLKAVADVNILVSSLIRPDGNSAQIISRIGSFISYTSVFILEATRRVLHYERILKKYQLSEEQIDQHLQKLRRSHLIVSGVYEV